MLDSIHQLKGQIRTLRIEYERFFSGAVDIPPEDLRNRIRRELRRLRSEPNISTAEDFQLRNVEAQFSSYSDLFQRRLRHTETHGTSRPATGAVLLDARKGVVVTTKVQPEVAQALYSDLSARSGTPPKFDLDSFQLYLTKQLDAVRNRTGATAVGFRVAEEDGKVKIKVKPIAAAPAG